MSNVTWNNKVEYMHTFKTTKGFIITGSVDAPLPPKVTKTCNLEYGLLAEVYFLLLVSPSISLAINSFTMLSPGLPAGSPLCCGAG